MLQSLVSTVGVRALSSSAQSASGEWCLRCGVWCCHEGSGWGGSSGSCVEADCPDRPGIGSTAAQWCYCWITAFQQQHAFAVPPYWQHDLFRMEPSLGCRFLMVTWWAPRSFPMNIGVLIPLCIPVVKRDKQLLKCLKESSKPADPTLRCAAHRSAGGVPTSTTST